MGLKTIGTITVAVAVRKLAMLTESASVMFVVAIAEMTSWTDAMNVCALPCTASANLDAIGMFAQSSISSDDGIVL